MQIIRNFITNYKLRVAVCHGLDREKPSKEQIIVEVVTLF